METYLDILGLTKQAHLLEEYIEAIRTQGTCVLDRMGLLRKLRNGAGVEILTGPSGSNFWTLASPEVVVRIIPDQTELSVKERTQDVTLWALGVLGLDSTLASNLVKAGGPKTKTHRLYSVWVEAQALVAELESEESEAIVNTEYPVEIIYDAADQVRFLSVLQQQVAMDYEWDIGTLEPLGLAVSDATRNYYLPVGAGGGGYLRSAVATIVKRLPTIWHNWKADCRTQWPGDPLEAFGCPVDDTLVMGYLLGENELGLKHLSRHYLGRNPLEYSDGLVSRSVDVAARYAAGGDSRNTYDLFQIFEAKLKKMGRQYSVYTDIERPLVPIIASMEKYGQPVDLDRMKELRDNFFQMEEALRSFWWSKEHLDISKDGDIRLLVHRRTNYDPGSCKQDVLAKIEEDWMDSILAYRRIRHRRRSFLDKHIARGQTIVHTDFNQAGSTDPHDPRGFKRAPRSGRLSSSGEAGNLQNQPGDIRSVFVAPDGWVLGVLDYASLELRTQAAVTQDPAMLAALGKRCDFEICPHKPKCGDLHDDLQLRVLALSGLDVGRTAAKNGNFNGSYGGTEAMLGTVLRKQRAYVTQDVLKLIVDSRRKAYPVYYQKCEAIPDDTRSKGYGETLFGRQRVDGDLWSTDSTSRGVAERSLINHIVGQGTAGDVVKLAMLRCVPVMQLYGAHLALQVHDELVFWLKKETAEQALTALKSVMESIKLPGIDLLVSAHLGSNWEDGKGA